MSIPLGSILQVSVLGQSNGQAVINVFHYAPFTLNPTFESSLTDVINGFRSAWRASVLPGLVDDYKVGEYRCVEIRGTEAVPGNPNAFRLRLGEAATVVGAGAADQGGDAGDPLPDYVAITVRKLTGLAGRTTRGSARFGPVSKAFVTIPNANALTGAGTAAGVQFSAFVKGSIGTVVPGDRINPVVFSRTTLMRPVQPKVDTIGARTAIIDAAANPFVGSQVSRKQRATLGA
jgi:hypothetical protein